MHLIYNNTLLLTLELVIKLTKKKSFFYSYDKRLKRYLQVSKTLFMIYLHTIPAKSFPCNRGISKVIQGSVLTQECPKS